MGHRFRIILMLIMLISTPLQAGEMRRNIDASTPKKDCDEKPCPSEKKQNKWIQFFHDGTIGQERDASILRDRK